ncbi:MAG: 23S rRNA (pseudouridine(1915)-N(3))-methyltransferase RlmH [Bacteroidetes Order II. Incertae sedis bacterium]|nr:23S rRNA (pseudouridine(1915)-N(3))-methyltransferase RlmH [Bacteroidetes Order II. bacterium]
MKIALWMIGKTAERYLEEGMAVYEKRLGHYVPFEVTVLPDVKQAKNLGVAQLKEAESVLVLDRLDKRDVLVLLDEKGKTFGSVAFAKWMEGQMNQSVHRMVMLIGGAYGFSEDIYRRAQFQISLSEMTFSHQLVRLVFLEQLYRAMTILKGEPYHHV